MTFRKQPSKPKARASPRKRPPTLEAKFQYIFIGKPGEIINFMSERNGGTGVSPVDSMTGRMPVLPKKVLLV